MGSADFSITSGSEGVLRGDMVLETDNSTIKLALIFDVIQHLHQVTSFSFTHKAFQQSISINLT